MRECTDHGDRAVWPYRFFPVPCLTPYRSSQQKALITRILSRYKFLAVVGSHPLSGWWYRTECAHTKDGCCQICSSHFVKRLCPRIPNYEKFREVSRKVSDFPASGCCHHWYKTVKLTVLILIILMVLTLNFSHAFPHCRSSGFLYSHLQPTALNSFNIP